MQGDILHGWNLVNCSFICDADENADYNSKPQFYHYSCYDED